MHPIDFQQRLQDNSVEETKVYLLRGVWTNKEAIMWNTNFFGVNTPAHLWFLFAWNIFPILPVSVYVYT